MRVDVDGVSVSLAGETVLDGVDAAVESGSFVGLVGPNGAGKTTLLRTMNGVLSPDAGRVSVGGDDVHALASRAASRRVATVPQDAAISFGFTVREFVAMGRHPHRSRFGRGSTDDAATVGDVPAADPVQWALDRTTTADLADRPVTEISGGERQRALVARALAQAAPVLLLDEPTASLDVTHQVGVLDLVADLVESEGRTVVAAIHDLTLAARYCDDLLLLGDGEVVARGPPEAVLREETLAAAFGDEAVVTRHPVTGTPLVTAVGDRADDRRGRVHVVGGGGAAAPLLARLDAAGFEVTLGPVGERDADREAARRLDVEAVTVEPHAPIDEATREDAAERVGRADATVLADVEVYPGSLPVLSLLDRAANPVVVERRPFDERNHAGDRARRRYDRLRDRALVAGPDDDLLATVGTAVAAEPSSPAEQPPPADD